MSDLATGKFFSLLSAIYLFFSTRSFQCGLVSVGHLSFHSSLQKLLVMLDTLIRKGQPSTIESGVSEGEITAKELYTVKSSGIFKFLYN